MNKEHILPQILLRSWPFPRGSGRLTDKFFRKLQFVNETDKVRTTDGFSIEVMPNDLIGRYLYLTGEFDRSTVEIVTAFAEPGDVLLDIGANIGYVSACFLTLVPDSRVVAVEPQPGILDLLRRNLEPFGDRSEIYPYAVSDRAGVALFQVNNENRGASKIANEGIEIEIRSAGQLFTECNLSPDVVKIDVEGHEEEVIRSCAVHFEQTRPKVVMFEEHGKKSAGAIGDVFWKIGFDVFSIRKRLTKLELLPVKTAEDCVSNDYLAVNRSRGVPKSARKAFGI